MKKKETAPPITCKEKNCKDCEIEGKLLCIHTKEDYFNFAVMFLGYFIPFLTGMLLGKHWITLAIWFVLAIFFFGYLEALILCRHCPHYAEKGFTLKCHANWGLPKIPEFNPHPANIIEKTI